jgi:hypothetical protein
LAQDHADGRIGALRGVGGWLILYPDRLRIVRQGLAFTGANLVFHVEREMDTVIALRELVGVHFVRSLLLVQFLRLTYPGCPTPSGSYLRDAFAENAFLYSLTDNRPLLGLTHEIARAAARAGGSLAKGPPDSAGADVPGAG